jgi:MATE family multidrug resistance protein
MAICGLALSIVPRGIIGLYTAEAAVAATGATLLRIAAFFQLCDGLQVVATGALRGLGDTRSPAIAHLLGYWAIGMPVAWVLFSARKWGAAGIWVGLSVALILIGAALVRVLYRALRLAAVNGTNGTGTRRAAPDYLLE